MSLSITYFDYDGSRGLECRLALTVAGVSFEDRRLQRDQWLALKPNTPFGSLPLLGDAGRVLAQSTAILTYLGRAHGLHPADLWRAAEHEAIMQSVEDLRAKVPGSRDMTPEAKQAAREAFAAGWLAQWSRAVSGAIVGPFLDGGDLQVADIKLYTILRAFESGGYDHLPWSVFDDSPKIQALYRAVDGHPKVRAYFASR